MKSKVFQADQNNMAGDAEKQKSFSKDEPDDDYALTSCGMGSWRPKWLQRFASPVYFLINMSLVGTIQSMSGPLFFSSISTLEKRYSFDSKVSGMILIADNFSQLAISPLIGYLAIRYNRSRLIGIGEMVLAFSCFISAMPYFIYGHAAHFLDDPTLASLSSNYTSYQVCSADNEFQKCNQNSGATVWPAVICLFIGSFFRGVGFTCYFVIGFPYLDDNVSKKNSPMYISIMQSIRLIGPAIGFLSSSVFLQLYENPFIDPGITRKDPRFVGAWWIGFLFVGVILFIAAFPMLFFPAQLNSASVKATSSKKRIKESGGFMQALKRFVTNPIVMMYIIGNIFRYIGMGGYFMMKTKYMESQFKQSSSSASFLTGTTSVLPVAIGILLGGFMMTIFKPKPRFIFIYVFLVESVSIFTIGSLTFLGCDKLDLSGQFTNTGQFSLDTSCSTGCFCDTRVYTPMCGPDQQTTYFSPCYAGCKEYNSFNKTFGNCNCFEGTASSGYCKKNSENCPNLYKYLLTILVGGIVSSTARTANSLISFRSVDPMDKGFTMGAASSMLAIFAFIPYPLIFGYIVDLACLVWEKKCGKTGNCWVYDQDKFRYYLHATSVFFLIIGSAFDFVMIFFSDRVKNFYGEDDEEVENDNNKLEMNKTNSSVNSTNAEKQLELTKT